MIERNIFSKIQPFVSGQNYIEFPEFATLMAKIFHQCDDDLEEAFQVFDQNGDGTISSSELAKTMKINGAVFTDKEMEHFMKNIDIDGNGSIDFDGE